MRPKTSRTPPLNKRFIDINLAFMVTSLATGTLAASQRLAAVRTTANKKTTPNLNHVQGIEPCHPASLNPQAVTFRIIWRDSVNIIWRILQLWGSDSALVQPRLLILRSRPSFQQHTNQMKVAVLAAAGVGATRYPALQDRS
jgi:hypothetical protein